MVGCLPPAHSCGLYAIFAKLPESLWAAGETPLEAGLDPGPVKAFEVFGLLLLKVKGLDNDDGVTKDGVKGTWPGT